MGTPRRPIQILGMSLNQSPESPEGRVVEFPGRKTLGGGKYSDRGNICKVTPEGGARTALMAEGQRGNSSGSGGTDTGSHQHPLPPGVETEVHQD